ncbi:MAG: EamA family transporter [Desulfovibrionaceae bacterium]|nr:EamA family transporter [Desulfovibrionaceae bacterium]
MPTADKPSATRVLIVLILVYIAWGSSYLGNKFCLEVAGPFLICGTRNILGGSILSLVAAVLAGRWTCPHPIEIFRHAVMAIILVLMTSGFIVLGQTEITSAVAAVLASMVPIMLILGGWIFAGEERPNITQWVGMIAGGIGVVALAWSQQKAGTSTLWGIMIALIANVAWVAGSLIMKKHPIAGRLSILESTGLLIFMGGIECFLLGLILGEQHSLHWENVNAATVIAFSWMVVGGSVLAYACYLWLLNNVSTAVAISYEYVTPVIAMALGTWLGGEEISGIMLTASIVIIISVFLVIRHKHSMRVYLRRYSIAHARPRH